MTPIMLSNFRESRSGKFFLVDGDDGGVYALPTQLLAANAKRFAELEEPVIVIWSQGWYYRTVSMIWTVENWQIEQARIAQKTAEWYGELVAIAPEERG